MTQPTDMDPAELARRVRQLAIDAYRVIRDPSASSRDFAEVCSQIDDLRRTTRSAAYEALDLWLKNTARLVQSHRPNACGQVLVH